MKKILCPTDFSEASLNAIGYAAKFAQQCDSELVLFNIQSIFSLPPGELLTKDPPTVEKARHTLEAQALEVTTAFNVSCYGEVQVSDDTLSSVISNRSEEFDLIIMGTNGPEDLYQFFFGKNTIKGLLVSALAKISCFSIFRYRHGRHITINSRNAPVHCIVYYFFVCLCKSSLAG